MPTRILNAVQLDADCCNYIQAPSRGCNAGAGPHIPIPADWSARILAGQAVPGCTYHVLEPLTEEPGTALTITDIAVGRLAVPELVAQLPAGPIRGQAVVLNVKINQAQNPPEPEP